MSSPRPSPPHDPALDFRWACEDCAHFVVERGACAHGYPNAQHLRAAEEPEFCKEFELA